ncbi:MAG: AIR synthase-related protein [Candidatus Ranarchaeia archaeon]
MKLPLGKLPYNLMNKLVFPHLPLADVEKGKRLDFSISIKDPNLVVATDPVLGVPLNSYGHFAVHYSAGDVAISGAIPQYISIGIYYPPETEENWLQNTMIQLGETARENEIQILGGHTGSYMGLSMPIISCTCIGKISRKSLDINSIEIGNDILLSGPVGREFSWYVSNDARELIPDSISSKEIERISTELDLLSTLEPAKKAISLGAVFLHDITEGGLMLAFNEIVRTSDLGLTIDEDAFPWDDLAIEIIKSTNGDPLTVSSFGSLIIVCKPENSEAIIESLSKINRPTNIVGSVTKSKELELFSKGKKKQLSDKTDPYLNLTKYLWKN